MYKKRTELPKNWPLARKGNVYYVIGDHSSNKGIPIVVVLRDILGVAKTNREVRVMLQNKAVLINQKSRRSEKFPVCLFDVVSLENGKKNFRLGVSSRKMKFDEITEKDSQEKVSKIIGKVSIGKNKFQMNLEDGNNFIETKEFFVGDSALVSLKENKVEKIISLKEKSKVIVISGKHSGKEGVVSKITMVNGRKEYLIKFSEGEAVLPLKTLVVTQ